MREMLIEDSRARVWRYGGTTKAHRTLCALYTRSSHRMVLKAMLHDSDELFRLAAQAGKMFAYEWDVATDVIVRSPEAAQILGIDEGEPVSGHHVLAKVHPDDRQRVTAAIASLTPEEPYLKISYRMERPDGIVIWVERNSRAHFDERGRMLRVVGMVADITERKVAEEALAGMTRKLVEAQEQERARIARELHDDINQRLALLTVELHQLEADPSQVKNRVREIQKTITSISNDIQTLSHDLHTSKLEYLGVAGAMKSWCREFGERQKLKIDFRHDLTSTLSMEIGLCLLRVLQEALHNATKHSGVKQMEVKLHEESGEVHLIVSDLGRGFDVAEAGQGKGLGLTSMRERVRLVNGSIAIESKPRAGTTIRLRVPIASSEIVRKLAG